MKNNPVEILVKNTASTSPLKGEPLYPIFAMDKLKQD
jgi:hypothetical protein